MWDAGKNDLEGSRVGTLVIDAATLPITGPCPIDLDTTDFDRAAKTAHCTHCSKSVHNLSNMSETEARAFLAARAGETMCVSYARDANGAVQFAASQPVAAPLRDGNLVPVAALRRRPATAVGIGFAAALAACTPVDNPQVGRPSIEHSESTLAERPLQVIPDAKPTDPEPVTHRAAEPTNAKPHAVRGKIRLPSATRAGR